MEENTNNGELAVQIYTDFKTALPETIKWNYDNLKKSLEDALAPLHGLVLTKDADGIKFAKGKRAAINKMMNLILDARVETKKKYLAPFEEFEQKANALITMCRTASGEFDSFVKVCECEIKEAKKRRIHDYLREKVSTTFGVNTEASTSPFWDSYENSNSRWMNATYKESDIRKEIDEKVSECEKALSCVKALFDSDAELKEKALIETVKDFDMNRVISVINSYKDEQKRIREAAERQKNAEAEKEKSKAEAMERAKAELAARRSEKSETANDSSEKPVQKTEDPIYTFKLRFNGNPERMVEMLRELVDCGISTDSCEMNLTAKLSSFRKFRAWLDTSDIVYENANK